MGKLVVNIIEFDGLTEDPTPLIEGKLWFRSDLQEFKQYINGSVSTVGDGSGTNSVFNSATNGLVPASGGGTSNYLRADGTWVNPSTGGGFDLWRVAYANNSAETNSTSYSVVSRLIFCGTNDIGTPTEIKALLEMNNTTDISCRIYDVTNAQTVVESTNLTTNTPTIVNLGAISNISTGEAIWEVQLLRTGGGGSGRARIHSLQIS